MSDRRTGPIARPMAVFLAAALLTAGGMALPVPPPAAGAGQDNASATVPQDRTPAAAGGMSPQRQKGQQPEETAAGQGVPTDGRQAPLVPMTVTVVRALDKITARSRLIELPEGQPVRFGTLEIVARHCESRPPEEEPETAAFLEIWDNRGGRHEKIFSGWMLASSPALHPLEHPVYDLWVIACRTAAPETFSGRR